MTKNPDYNYKITVEMTEKTLHDYMKYRTKTNAGTIFPYIFVAVFIYELIKTWGEVSMLQSAFYLIFEIVFAIGVPLNAKMQAKRSFRPGSRLGDPVNYYLTEEGITRGTEEEGIIPWDRIYRVDTTALNIIIFATNKMAFFIPKENVPTYEEVRAFMLSKMRPKQARMDDLYGTLAEE